jgi:hypothetical protein
MRILLADNRTAEKAEREPEPLAELLESLETTEDGLTGTGYSSEDLNEVLDDLEMDVGAEDQSDMLEPTFKVIVECEDEFQQQDLIEQLESNGYECEALIL